MAKYNKQKEETVKLEEAFRKASELLLSSITSTSSFLTPEKRIYYRDKPIEFAIDILGDDPWEKQREILQALVDYDRVVIRSSNSVGKTFISRDVVLWFLNSYFPSTVVTTAPKAKQVKELLWKEINAGYSKSKVPLGGKILQQELVMSEKEKWFATGFTIQKQNIDSFQGYHNDYILVVVDEACGVAKEIYEAIEGLIASGKKAKLLLIGNPTNEATEFGKVFKSSAYKKFHISAFDTPNFTKFGITPEDIEKNKYKDKIKGELPRPYLVSPEWVRGRFEAWGKDSPLYQVRVEGNFPKEGVDTLIPLYWVERANDKGFPAEGKKYMGVDIGAEGDDESIAAIRQGKVVTRIYSWFHKNTMESVGMIGNLIKEENPEVTTIDASGLGTGVYDRLKELGFKVNGIGRKGLVSSSRPDVYFNLRTELYWLLRTALEKEELELPKDDLLSADLTNQKMEPLTSAGQMKLEAKEKVKKRIGRSPDRSDAIAYTFYDKQAMIVSEDIGSFFSGKPASGEDEKSKSMIGVDYRKLNLRYNNIKTCEKCGNSAGLVFYDDVGLTKPEDAKYVKCIICDMPGLSGLIAEEEKK